jgi:MFS family permease
MLFEILKLKNARNYFFADTMYNIGTGILLIGLNWYILEASGKNSEVGILMAIGLVSGFIASLFAGTIADRFNRRSVMVFLNIVRIIFLSGMIFLLYIGYKNLFLIYIISVINCAGWTMFLPASRGLIQEIFSKKDLIKGNSLIEISTQFGSVIAALLCGFVYKLFGFNAILGINIVAFIISTFFILQIKYKSIEILDKHETFFNQFKNGVKYLKENFIILIFGIVISIPFTVTIASNTVLPGYVKNSLNASAIVFGVADMSYCIGAFISGFFAAILTSKFSRSICVYTLFILSITSLFFLFINKFIIGVYIGMLFFGYANASLKIITYTIAMEIIPKTHFGRATAVFLAISTVMQLALVTFAGKMMDIVSSSFGFLCLSITMIVGLILILSIMPILDRQKVEDASEKIITN